MPAVLEAFLKKRCADRYRLTEAGIESTCANLDKITELKELVAKAEEKRRLRIPLTDEKTR